MAVNKAHWSAFCYAICWGSLTSAVVALIGRLMGDMPCNAPSAYIMFAGFIVTLGGMTYLKKYSTPFPGRLDSLGSMLVVAGPVMTIVLNMHTDPNLPAAFLSCAAVSLSVFGYFCFVDADRLSRERTLQSMKRLADKRVLTSDNPRPS